MSTVLILDIVSDNDKSLFRKCVLLVLVSALAGGMQEQALQVPWASFSVSPVVS